MPSLALFPSSKFSRIYTQDDSLPNGEIAIPFALQFTNTGDNIAVQTPIGLLACQKYVLDARTIQNVQNYTQAKSFKFLAQFLTVSTPSPEPFGDLFFYSPDSGDIVRVATPIAADQTLSADSAWVQGQWQIVTNTGILWILARVPHQTGCLINLCGLLCNFELPPVIAATRDNF